MVVVVAATVVDEVVMKDLLVMEEVMVAAVVKESLMKGVEAVEAMEAVEAAGEAGSAQRRLVRLAQHLAARQRPVGVRQRRGCRLRRWRRRAVRVRAVDEALEAPAEPLALALVRGVAGAVAADAQLEALGRAVDPHAAPAHEQGADRRGHAVVGARGPAIPGVHLLNANHDPRAANPLLPKEEAGHDEVATEAHIAQEAAEDLVVGVDAHLLPREHRVQADHRE